MKCYRKNGSDSFGRFSQLLKKSPSMKCYRKNGSDPSPWGGLLYGLGPSMKCYRKNGSDASSKPHVVGTGMRSLNEVLPKER